MVTTSNKGNADRVVAASFATAGLLCHPAGQPKQRLRARQGEETTQWRASPKDPGDLGVNYGRRGWTNGRDAISWTDTIATAGDGVFYRGHRLMWWAGSADNFNWYSVESHSVSVVCAWPHGGRVFVVLSVENFDPPYLFTLEVVCFDLARVDGGLAAENPSVIYQREIEEGDYEIGASQSLNGRSLLYFTRDRIIRLDFSTTENSVAASVQSQVGGTESSSLDWDVWREGYHGPGSREGWNIDWRETKSGSGEWVVGAIWAPASGVETETWQPVVLSRTYASESTLVGENFWSSSNISVRSWSGSATSSEFSTLTFPWGAYTLVDASASWAGESSSGPEYTRLWFDDYVENIAITKTVDRRVYALIRNAMLAVSIGGSYEVREGVIPKKTGATGLSVNSSFTLPGFAPQYTSDAHPLPMSVHTASTHPAFPIAMPLQTRGVLPQVIIGSAASMGNAVAMSIPDGDGGYINYMTDNPAMTGVFPDTVDLDGAFYPIVPV